MYLNFSPRKIKTFKPKKLIWVKRSVQVRIDILRIFEGWVGRSKVKKTFHI